MKKYFVVSLVKNGLLGGGIVVEPGAIVYHTGKISIPQEYRRLEIKYEDICEVTKGWLFIFPTVSVKMRNEKTYTFAVFFSRNRLVNALKEMGVSI